MLQVLCGLAAFYSIHLLVVCSIITGKNSYEELAHSVFGRTTEIIVDISIIVFTWGSAVAYMVIIGTAPRELSHTMMFKEKHSAN